MKSKYTVILFDNGDIVLPIKHGGNYVEVVIIKCCQRKRLSRKVMSELVVYKPRTLLRGHTNKTLEEYITTWQDKIIKVYEVD